MESPNDQVKQEVPFKEWPKTHRLNRQIIVTEKIDGSNGVIYISEDLTTVLAGSRNRWLSVGKGTDNFGFAAWVEANRTELLKLGPGYHYGEWYGQGIQRTYGLTERRFALFNVGRWVLDPAQSLNKPACCETVPILYSGAFDNNQINIILVGLSQRGSKAVPGFMSPEGVIVYHSQSKQCFKVTLENDAEGKGTK